MFDYRGCGFFVVFFSYVLFYSIFSSALGTNFHQPKLLCKIIYSNFID